MATTVTKVIDPNMGSGYDYDSVYDWEAAQQGDLTGARDEIAVAKCRCTGGSADTAGRTDIDGWVCSSTQYIKIWTDPTESYRHLGKYPTSGNYYRMEPTDDNSYTLYIVESFIRLIGIAAKITSNAGRTDYVAVVRIQEGEQALISHCVLKGKSGCTNSNCLQVIDGCTGPIKIYNTILQDFPTGSGNSGLYFDNGTTNQTGYLYNCLVHNCTNGFQTNRWETHDSRNNIAYGCTTGWSGQWNYAYNNSTELASSGITAANTSGNRTSQSFGFVDGPNDDFHLTSSDTGALGYGQNLYNDANLAFQDDIDSQDRGGSGATWDIGPDEYVSSSLSIHASECVGSEGVFN